jgi:hypothetical protein
MRVDQMLWGGRASGKLEREAQWCCGQWVELVQIDYGVIRSELILRRGGREKRAWKSKG